MKFKTLALSGAAALALALGANTSFAQTPPNNQTNSTSAPAQDQAAPADATNQTNDANLSPTAKPVHHYRHHAKNSVMSDETPAEHEATVNLNQQELAKVESNTNTSTASTSTAGSADASNTTAQNMPAQNANAGAQNTEVAANAPSGAGPANGVPAQNTPAGQNDQPAATNGTTMNAQSMNAPATSPQGASTANATNAAAQASLDTVSNPKSTLASAKVENASGQQIGQVKRVNVGSNGKTQAVDIVVQGANGSTSKTVRVDANDLSYDKDNNVLVTPLSQDQLNSMQPSPM
jgi:trimeric autotransporter adhesin